MKSSIYFFFNLQRQRIKLKLNKTIEIKKFLQLICVGISMCFNHKKINFSPWLINELSMQYKIIEKSSMSKSFSVVLSVKKNKKINTWLSRNKEIEIILN